LSACGSLLVCVPPPCAKSGLPLPPPPRTAEASLAIRLAFIPCLIACFERPAFVCQVNIGHLLVLSFSESIV